MALPLPPSLNVGSLSAVAALTPLIESTYVKSTISFYLNGSRVDLSNPNPEWTLLDFLRVGQGLKGTKLGCGEGGCGACTVVLQTLDRQRPDQYRHLAVNACLFPLVGVEGKHVITIEGISDQERPHPLQERIYKLHGSQCGFCTPGIVMSLYALIRNAYDPQTKKFRLSERDIELDGHLDGNLCRCTGYKPILQAAKTFVVEDLKGELEQLEIEDHEDLEESPEKETFEQLRNCTSTVSCGRPGGCCRDKKPMQESNSSDASSTSQSSDLEDSAPTTASSQTSSDSEELSDKEDSLELDLTQFSFNKPNESIRHLKLIPYKPRTELIFPPSLRRWNKLPLCYGDSTKLWFRPTTLEQLVELKNAYPAAKLVGGSSEVQVEIKFKNSKFPVSVYVSDIQELCGIQVPKAAAAIASMKELVIPANTSLSDIEQVCKDLGAKLGKRGHVVRAMGKQLRYFAGRQIRNVSSIAGNIATASPISDMNPVLMAAGAILTVRNLKQGTFELPMETFFKSYRATSLPEDAVITHVTVPLPLAEERQVLKAYKQAKRKDDDIAIVTCAFRVRLDKDDMVEDIALVYGGMAPVTTLAKQTMQFLQGKKWYDPEVLDEARDELLKEFNLPFGVPGAMATYRRTLTISLFTRFWNEVNAELGIGSVDTELVREIHRGISSGKRDNFNPNEQQVVGKQLPHLSSLKQTMGMAEYLDDMPKMHGELFGALVMSSRAHAKLINVDWSDALAMPGVRGYVDKNLIPPNANSFGAVVHDEEILADSQVRSEGQIIGLIYADTALQAQAGARAVKVEYENLPAILTIDEAIAANSFFGEGWRELRKGRALEFKMDEAFAECAHVFEGVSRMGGQEHFYLETTSSLAIPLTEDGAMEVYSATQNTTKVQEYVAKVIGVSSSKVNARVRRMGGAFGGKEARSTSVACVLALAAKKSKRPVRMMLNRDEDMITTGQRHPFKVIWKVGTDAEGKLLALDVEAYNNAGWSLDMSMGVMSRFLSHFDSCYEVPDCRLRGRVCKTNIHTNTGFRGFGGPQALHAMETMLCVIAEKLNLNVDEVRMKNFYRPGDHTPFFQKIDQDWHIPLLMEQLRIESDYDRRRAEVDEFNRNNRWKKRGISMIPTKYGLALATAIFMNQGSANVKIFQDGSVLLNHGGTEMGQGLYTKMVQIAAQELGVPMESVYTQDTSSYHTANASPTGGSTGTDLNGMAVKNACDQINERIKPYREKLGPNASMADIAMAAYLDRVNLAAAGFWKMPGVGFEWGNFNPVGAKPMYQYFTQGGAVSEVELDLLTGDHTVLRTDIKMDVGRSINPAIDYGQIEGAFVQGQGLFTMEESLWTRDGRLFTRGPGTYKIPGFSDIPQIFNVTMLQGVSWKHVVSIQSSRGLGEPPLLLGSTIFFALRDALKSARQDNGIVEPLLLQCPATAENLRLCVGDPLVKAAEVKPKEGEKPFLITVF